jgi:hypothetical protein
MDDVVCYLGGVLLSVQMFPQIKRVIWNRSSSVICVQQVGANILGSLCIASYGLQQELVPLYVMMFASSVNYSMLMCLGFYYDRMECVKEGIDVDNVL